MRHTKLVSQCDVGRSAGKWVTTYLTKWILAEKLLLSNKIQI